MSLTDGEKCLISYLFYWQFETVSNINMANDIFFIFWFPKYLEILISMDFL